MVGLCVRMCQGAGNDGGTRENDAPDNDQFCRMKMKFGCCGFHFGCQGLPNIPKRVCASMTRDIKRLFNSMQHIAAYCMPCMLVFNSSA
jgi:hypothetical protein